MERRPPRQVFLVAVVFLAGFTGMMLGATLGWPRVGSPSEPATDYQQECPVVEVVDGDTLDVEWTWHGALDERIRMLNIDTPERGEPGHEEAAAAARKLVEGSLVRLEFEKPGVPARGKYGRLLVYVFNARGENVNVELVRLGWSRFETEYGVGRYAADFRRAEEEARERKAGLWRQ